MSNNIHWYEVCFWHDENEDEAEEKACSFIVKTEIEDVLQGEKAAPEILLRSFCNPYTAQEYRDNLTAVFEVDESEARFFDVDDLTERVTDELGTYYKRKSA
jgi:hypothetical protein